ncbi:hypothetical protein [Janthinobacterium lividum]|uniref:hypothetical protein n=1 Tax=Janthinobacterium lividum TaxID=29581 RepID=UPI001595E1A0|nr:hypothetical protein G8765_13815 [Janthinobacterium lividum]
MRDHPIIFTGPMVRALLDGSKTQTRRVVKLQRLAGSHFEGGAAGVEFDGFRVPRDCGLAPARFSAEVVGGGAYLSEEVHCPYGQPGDRIWVRETFGYVSPDEHQRPHSECNIEYRADLEPDCTDRPCSWPVGECAGDPARPRWRPSIHMPRAASRILLEIVSVRVERLQDISDADIVAEGIDMDALAEAQDRYDAIAKNGNASGRLTLRTAWRDLWESTGGDWHSNPWLWVIEFKRVTP